MTELERLFAKEEIRTLQARYVRIADSKDWRALSELFIEGATFTAYDVAGKEMVVMTGRNDIASGIEANVGSAVVLHHLFSYEIGFRSDKEAHGVWSMEDWIDHQTAPDPDSVGLFRTMRGYGHYHNDYRKVENDWLIADLKLHRTRMDFTY